VLSCIGTSLVVLHELDRATLLLIASMFRLYPVSPPQSYKLSTPQSEDVPVSLQGGRLQSSEASKLLTSERDERISRIVQNQYMCNDLPQTGCG
jgi:hypothetical protein